jgi:hypothetical protein
MDVPVDLDRPFFSYGIFRPGQLAYFQLRDLVSRAESAQARGTLLLRDGLPIADPAGHGYIIGTLLTFGSGQAAIAYERVTRMEPDRHYRWHRAELDGVIANMLVGKSPKRGSVPCEDVEWNGWSDPLLTTALDVVQETLAGSKEFEWDLKPLFRLQMAYLLLWSSIERYVSLRYHLGEDVMAKISRLAGEPAFAESLRGNVTGTRTIYRTDRPVDREILDPGSPGKSLNYYYQVRSNITHRGKGVVQDHKVLVRCLEELLVIFREVLKVARQEAIRDASLYTG